MGKEWMASIGKFETKTVRMIKYMEEISLWNTRINMWYKLRCLNLKIL